MEMKIISPNKVRNTNAGHSIQILPIPWPIIWLFLAFSSFPEVQEGICNLELFGFFYGHLINFTAHHTRRDFLNQMTRHLLPC